MGCLPTWTLVILALTISWHFIVFAKIFVIFATIPNSPIPTKWSNQKPMDVMLAINVDFNWTATNM
jgi:hypothetical protein